MLESLLASLELATLGGAGRIIFVVDAGVGSDSDSESEEEEPDNNQNVERPGCDAVEHCQTREVADEDTELVSKVQTQGQGTEGRRTRTRSVQK